MQIHEDRQGAVTTLRPIGPLVQKDAEHFRERGLRAIAESRGRTVVDASGIAYVDSAGIEALLDLADELGAAGASLKLCAANETVREVLEVTEVGAAFEYFADVSSAVRSYL